MFGGGFQLASGETREIVIEATGKTYRLETDRMGSGQPPL